MKPPKKIEVPLDKFNRLINHGPVLLVTTHDGEKANVCTVAWNMPCARKPPAVAITLGPTSYTHEVLLRTKECVLNVPGTVLLEDVVRCGSSSGRTTDKFASFWLSPKGGRHVKAPWVAEAIGHLECRLAEGAEDLVERYSIFVLEVLGCWAEERIFEGGRWMPENGADALHHLGGEFFAVCKKVLVQG